MSYFANGKVKNEKVNVMKLSNASLGQAYSDCMKKEGKDILIYYEG